MNPSSYLSDLEIEKLTTFSNDEVMREAVRKVLLAGVYSNGVLKRGKPAEPDMNFALMFENQGFSDVELGQFMRASTTGIGVIQAAFDEIKRVANTPVVPKAATSKKPNRAQ